MGKSQDWCDGWMQGAIAVGFLLTSSETDDKASRTWEESRDEYLSERAAARAHRPTTEKDET